MLIIGVVVRVQIRCIEPAVEQSACGRPLIREQPDTMRGAPDRERGIASQRSLGETDLDPEQDGQHHTQYTPCFHRYLLCRIGALGCRSSAPVWVHVISVADT